MENLDRIISKKETAVISEEAFLEKFPEFFETLGEELPQEHGARMYEKGELRIELATKNVSIEDFPVDTYPELNTFLVLGMFTGKFNIGEYHQLTGLKLENATHTYDLAEDKKKPVILIKKNADPQSSLGYAHHEENLVVIEADPSSAGGILVLLHELGHIHDERLGDDKLRQRDLHLQAIMLGGATGEIDKERDAITLRQERSAWAYALQKIKPFVSDIGVPHDAVDQFVHEFTLGSYCAAMSQDYEDYN